MHQRKDDCEYSHSKDSPRVNSPVGGKKSVCYAFLQGKCTKGKDCKYIHNKKALAVVKASVKAAWSKSSGSPSNTPRGGEGQSESFRCDDESDNDSFCSDVSTVSEIAKGCMKRVDKRDKIPKDKKLKFNNKHDVIKYHAVSDHFWSKAFSRKRIGERVSEKELKDSKRTDQIKYEELRSKVRGLALERSTVNPKKGNARARINGTWKLDITVNKDHKSPDLFIEKFYRDEDEDNEGNSDLPNANTTAMIKRRSNSSWTRDVDMISSLRERPRNWI